MYLFNNASVCNSIWSPSYDPVPDVYVHSLMLTSSIHSSRRFRVGALFYVHFSSTLFFLLFKSASLQISRKARDKLVLLGELFENYAREWRGRGGPTWVRRRHTTARPERPGLHQNSTRLRQKWHFPGNSPLISKFLSTREISKEKEKHLPVHDNSWTIF